jgi:hypothetical protein
MKKKDLNNDDVKLCCKNALTMSEAYRLYLENNETVGFNTFVRVSKELGCYNPNKSGKGTSKQTPKVFSTQDIIDGKVPTFQTNKLRKRLLKDGLFKEECCICKLTEWNGKPIPLELDHINGINNDHRLCNLRIICPNCHAQTDTYKGKNIKNARVGELAYP